MRRVTLSVAGSNHSSSPSSPSRFSRVINICLPSGVATRPCGSAPTTTRLRTLFVFVSMTWTSSPREFATYSLVTGSARAGAAANRERTTDRERVARRIARASGPDRVRHRLTRSSYGGTVIEATARSTLRRLEPRIVPRRIERVRLGRGRLVDFPAEVVEDDRRDDLIQQRR